ncbi:hypothetical protein PF010_g838 [Phytophthora fragariae]|uniref:Uncharacterized protein n=1 Tax=Phytophthora fragariae TaxID=53985 RepID=A0A6G0M1S7_9STRA|nr:hypothetical protein PF010_g838 [Phytophthora fragariae]
MRESCTDRDQLWERIRRSTIATELKRVGVELLVAALETDSGPPCALNAALQAAMSEYARRAKPSLRAFVELIRCQTTDDYRPNEALVPVVLRRHCHGYEHLDALPDIAAEGVRVHLREPLPRQGRWPKTAPPPQSGSRWTGSAGTYSVLGGAVAFVHGNSVDANHPAGFFNYDWVDDHVNIEPDVGTRCADAERSLRYAMAAVMGPRAVHEDKFTAWRPRQKVLGLMFDTSHETVSISPDKITKAKRIVSQAYHASRLSRTMMRSLLGSLRHVATCVRPAQAFLQRLRAGEKNLHRCAHVTITPSMREDLIWWWHILCHPTINGVRLNCFRHASWSRLCRVHRRV